MTAMLHQRHLFCQVTLLQAGTEAEDPKQTKQSGSCSRQPAKQQLLPFTHSQTPRDDNPTLEQKKHNNIHSHYSPEHRQRQHFPTTQLPLSLIILPTPPLPCFPCSPNKELWSCLGLELLSCLTAQPHTFLC